MKLAVLIGICAVVGGAMYGCSSASQGPSMPTEPNTTENGNPGTNTNGTGGGSSLGAGDQSGSAAPIGTGSSGGTGGSVSGATGASGTGGATTGTAASGDTSGSGSSTGGSSGGMVMTPIPTGDGDGGLGGGIMASDAAPLDNTETDYSQTKTVTMDSFTVPANQEVFYCQTFANPWGKQVDIKTYALEMDKGSHHMFAFYKDNATDGTAAPCAAGGLTYGTFTFVSQTAQLIETFPQTVGATIPASKGFNLMVHYLNTGSTSLQAHVTLTMYVAKDGVVTNHAGVIFMNNITMTVPADGMPHDSTASLSVAQAVTIMATTSHMHKFATNFVETATPPSGQPQQIYTTTQWDEPKPQIYTTPLQFPANTKYTWTCTDVNNTGKTLTFGEYAQTNVMCIAVAIYYPVMNVNNPTLGSVLGGF